MADTSSRGGAAAKTKNPRNLSRGLFAKSWDHLGFPDGPALQGYEANYFAASSPSFLSSPFLAFLPPFFLAGFFSPVSPAGASSAAEANVVLAKGIAKARARRITRVSFIGDLLVFRFPGGPSRSMCLGPLQRLSLIHISEP